MILYLQTRKDSEPWHTLNQLEYSSDLGMLNCKEELERMQAGYIFDFRFTNHKFRIFDKLNNKELT